MAIATGVLVSTAALVLWLASFLRQRDSVDVAGGALTPGSIPSRYQGVALVPGRARDAIPPMDYPEFAAADSPQVAMASLEEGDWVLAVGEGREARAYPLWILEGREIVNDSSGDVPICVTYCPLSASGLVFEARVDGRLATFGNEGALYECNLVLYDRETRSLWYQLRGVSIAGPREGTRLRPLPYRMMRWRDWRHRHTGGRVLVGDQRTGRLFRVPKGISTPSEVHNAPAFPVSRLDPRLPPMEKVVGLEVDGTSVCVTASWWKRLPEGRHPVPGHPGIVMVSGVGSGLSAFGVEGREIPVVEAYWFAWHAAFPAGAVVGISE